ncbi:MAG: hypothetical protein AB2L17_14595 [Lentimicrobium sp.]|jgi:hypothetical protein
MKFCAIPQLKNCVIRKLSEKLPSAIIRPETDCIPEKTLKGLYDDRKKPLTIEAERWRAVLKTSLSGQQKFQ